MSYVVIIEDAKDVGQALCDFAIAAGFTPAHFSQFDQSTLAACRRASHILLDLNMPGHDGLDVIDALSKEQLSVPVILCSGVAENIIDSAGDVLTEQGLVFGGKLLKPFTYEQFVGVLTAQKESSDDVAKVPLAPQPISLSKGDLSIAIRRNWFYPVFQPQINTTDNTLIGVECLARLRHPLFGELSPAIFIPRLVEVGLINDFTRNIIETGLAQLALIGYPSYGRVSFNIDSSSLSPPFLMSLLEHVGGHYIQPSQVCLEITELSAVGMTKELKAMLAKLRLNGLHISLDDFGTGFSTVHELDQLPFSELKIDRSFVINMSERAGSLAIVKNTIGLANDLNMLVVAEGIETAEQASQLQSLGCNCMQGFYFARPMEAKELKTYITTASRKNV